MQSAKPAASAWNQTPYHHVPFALRGIRPLKREPWDADRSLRNKHAQRVGVGPSCLDAPWGGSTDTVTSKYDEDLFFDRSHGASISAEQEYRNAISQKWAAALCA